MIKSKASMNFSHTKGFMTIQNKALSNQVRTGSGNRMIGPASLSKNPGAFATNNPIL